MTIKIGDKIPAATVKVKDEAGIPDVKTEEFFAGKKVALFGVPGAFTPTCSAQHIPSFLKNADALRAKGVDTIACISVNDAFVMASWGKDQGVGDNIVMLADGNAEFAKATGLELDASGFGMGTRNVRYSAIVDNGVVTHLNVEEGGAYEVSSAEKLLEQM